MTHAHHDAGSEGFAAASWMMAMFGVIIAVVLAVAILVWAPWGSNNGGGTTNTNNNTEQQAPADDGGSDGGGVNIEGNDVDVGDVPEVPGQ